MNRSALLILAILLPLAAPAEPPGAITFIGENAFSTADGTFHDWRIVRADIDPADPGSGVVEVEVDVASLDTGIERRDDHLRTADFFEVEKWPTARVRIHSATADGESERGNPRYRAKFDLRIRNVEKTLDGSFEVVSEAPLAVAGGLTLNRVDFGIGGSDTWWNPASIGEEIPVRFTATLAR